MRQQNNWYWLWINSRKIRMRIILSGLVGILRISCGLGFIYTSKELIDIATGAISGVLLEYVVWLVVLMFGSIICNSVVRWITIPMEVSIQNNLRQRLFEKLLQSRERGTESLHSGDIQSRLGVDVRQVSSLLAISIPQLLISSIQLLASFIFLQNLDGKLAYIIGISMLIVFFFGRIYAERMRILTHRVRSAESAVCSLTQESIQHQIVIKTLKQTEAIVSRLSKLQSSLLGMENKRLCFSVFSKALLSCGFMGCYLFIFIWSAIQLEEGIITVGVMTAFLQLAGQVQRPIVELTRLFPSFVTAMTSADRLRALEQLECEDQGSSIILDGRVGLRINNICFGYTNRQVLKNFSFDFTPGSVTAILGESGVGKTTLVRLMLALMNPQNGKLTLYNKDREVEVSALTRENFNYVPQGNTLFSGTIRENLLLGNPQADEQQIKDVLYGAAAEFVYSLPKGLDFRCGERGVGLSEGQSQRIAIARTLLRPGSILLLDEATSALDRDTEKLLIHRILTYSPERTILFITHRDEVINDCDQIVFLPNSSEYET